MTECPPIDHLLVIPRLRVQNANAVSSPLTHGFPSITAFLGLMWALERKASAAGLPLQFNAVGVICHRHEEQITQGDFVNAFRLTRNPIEKDGGTAAIVEEGRIHLDISLVFGVQDASWPDQTTLQASAEKVRELIVGMRIAGGSVIPSSVPSHRQTPYWIALTGDEQGREALFNRAKLRLLPGFVLVGRDDLLGQRLQDLQVPHPPTSRLDAWLSLSRINWRYAEASDSDPTTTKTQWLHDRKQLGWVVPIPVGYGALGPLHPPGTVPHTRDTTTPFRFVESLYSVGQWISPHRLHSPQQLLWYADSRPEVGLYRCRNDYRPSVAYDFD